MHPKDGVHEPLGILDGDHPLCTWYEVSHLYEAVYKHRYGSLALVL